VRADADAILRQRVVEQHSAEHWADRVIEVVASLRTPARV
jgi:hypothetical protein